MSFSPLPRFGSPQALRHFLDEQAFRFENPDFIESDPISVPHRFTGREDREVSGLLTAILAWGQRRTILQKMGELIERMDGAPADFVRNHGETDLRRMEGFVHRTFQDTDLLFMLDFLRHIYRNGGGLEAAFFPPGTPFPDRVEKGLNGFRKAFVSHPGFPARTGKHVASPARGSACKRLNMFLRWMVRPADRGVDFGIWKSVAPRELICPCDLHVERVARALGLFEGLKPNWKGAVTLTASLREFDPEDPVRYDFALFGTGVSGRIF